MTTCKYFGHISKLYVPMNELYLEGCIIIIMSHSQFSNYLNHILTHPNTLQHNNICFKVYYTHNVNNNIKIPDFHEAFCSKMNPFFCCHFQFPTMRRCVNRIIIQTKFPVSWQISSSVTSLMKRYVIDDVIDISAVPCCTSEPILTQYFDKLECMSMLMKFWIYASKITLVI